MRVINLSINVLIERIRDTKTKVIMNIMKLLYRLPSDQLAIFQISKYYLEIMKA